MAAVVGTEWVLLLLFNVSRLCWDVSRLPFLAGHNRVWKAGMPDGVWGLKLGASKLDNCRPVCGFYVCDEQVDNNSNQSRFVASLNGLLRARYRRFRCICLDS